MARSSLPIRVESCGDDEYLVRVGAVTEHRVRATPAALHRAGGGAEPPPVTLERAFRFLLERESPHSILRRFSLEDVARYFPEFWSEMARQQ